MQNDWSPPTGPGEPGLVSVVIPAYNRAHLVAETIESVLSQTYGPLEVIVVDDGSRDNTREVVERFGPPVRYLYQSNAGVSAARNTGFAAARGEYIALLDSDDLWLPWKLEAQVALMRRFPEVGMIWTDMSAIDERGDLLHERYLRRFYYTYQTVSLEEVCEHAGPLASAWEGAPPAIAAAPFYKGDIFSEMIMGNLVHTSTVLLRRERVAAAGGFDVALRPAGEDYEYHLRTCSHGPVGLLDAPSILYRIGAADQITAPHHDIHFARSNLLTIQRWLARGRGRITLSAAALSGRLAHAHGWVGMAELDEGNRRAAMVHLLASLRHRIAQPRVLLFFLLSLLPVGVFGTLRHLRRRVRASVRTVAARAYAPVLGLTLPEWSELLLGTSPVDL